MTVKKIVIIVIILRLRIGVAPPELTKIS